MKTRSSIGIQGLIRAMLIVSCLVFAVSCQQRRDEVQSLENRDTSAVFEAESLSTATQTPRTDSEEPKGIHELEWERHRTEVLLTDSTISEFQQGIEAGGQGDWQRAAHIFEKITREHPNNPKAHFNLGLCYKYLRDYSAARRSLERANDLQPDSLFLDELRTVEAWEKEHEKLEKQ